ncbi:MAG: hypothetical protein V4543_06845 [Bacteroidota bacterium]
MKKKKEDMPFDIHEYFSRPEVRREEEKDLLRAMRSGEKSLTLREILERSKEGDKKKDAA